MTAEAAGEQEVRDAGRGSDKWVLIEDVIVVVSRPRRSHANRLERRHAVREYGPRAIFEQRIVYVEVVGADVRVGIRRRSAQESIALRPKPQPGRIDHQRAARNGNGASEHEHVALAREHRQLDADARGQFTRPRACGVHCVAAADAAESLEPCCRDAPIGRQLELDDAIAQVPDAAALIGAAQGHEQGMSVKPALTTRRIGACREIRRVEPRIARGERGRLVKRDRYRRGLLNRHPLLEDRAAGGGRQEKITRFNQAHFRRRSGLTQESRRRTQKIHAEPRQLDVDGRRELQADGACGARACRLPIARVRLDDEDRAGKAQGAQEVGARRTHRAAACDYHVELDQQRTRKFFGSYNGASEARAAMRRSASSIS